MNYFQTWRGFSRNAWLFLLSSLIGGINMGIGNVVFNLFVRGVGFDETFIGTLIAVSSITAAVCALPAGLVSDRFGRKLSLIAGAVMACSGALIQVVMPLRWPLLLAALLNGVASAFAMVIGAPFLAENSTSKNRAHLFGANSALGTISMVCGSFLGGALPGAAAGVLRLPIESAAVYRLTLSVGLVMAAVSIIPYLLIREMPHLPAENTIELRGVHFSDIRLAAKLAVPMLVSGLGAGMVIPFLNLFFANRGAGPGAIGLVIGLSDVVTTLGFLASPLLVRRMRKVDAAVLTQVLGILLLLVMALSRSFAIAAIAALFRGMLANMGGPLISSFSMELVPAKERATINSVTEMAWSLGWAVSARVGGWMITRYSYELPYFFTSGLYLVCAGLYWSFFHKSKHNITLEHQESAISG